MKIKHPILLITIIYIIMMILTELCKVTAIGSPLDQKEQAHQIAELAREMSLQENDPIILRAKELWEEADRCTYTEQDAEMIAKTLAIECPYVKSTTEQACVVWCILNRVDAGQGTIKEVVTAPNQFAYKDSSPVIDELLSITYDVLYRWQREHNGESNVGRVLPLEYDYFGGNGLHNTFRTEFTTNSKKWDFSLKSPYIT